MIARRWLPYAAILSATRSAGTVHPFAMTSEAVAQQLWACGLKDLGQCGDGGFSAVHLAEDVLGTGVWPISAEGRRHGVLYALKIIGFASHRGMTLRPDRSQLARNTAVAEIAHLRTLRGVSGVVTLHGALWSPLNSQCVRYVPWLC